jgi:hypothetical protein
LTGSLRRHSAGVRIRLLVLIALTVALVAGLLPTAASAQTATSAQAATSARQVVTYLGVRLNVPAGWPVYDLASDPRRCVLFNTSAVYLGDQAPQAACPASAVGVALAVQLRPATAGAATPAAGTAVDNTTAHRIAATARGGRVQAVISYLDHNATLSGLLADLGASSIINAPPTPIVRSLLSPASAAAAAARPTAAPAAGFTTHAAAAASTPTLGFDSCGAPSVSTMAAWYASSPYRTAGVYLGGANRACPDGNLSANWITTVGEQGWNFIPIYVGLQAPCVNQGGLAPISSDLATASAQGRNAADDAVAQATRFGMRAGTPIYFDSEAYNNTVSGCSQIVLTFLSAWSSELRAQNYFSGVYGSSSSTIHDLAGAVQGGGYALPDDIWLANWNDNTSVFGDRFIPDGYWSNHQRLHQYHGGHDESWGGVTINIDNDSIDGATAIPGNGPPLSLQVFSATASNHVMTAWEFAPAKPFDPWIDLQIPVAAAGSPILGVNQNGQLQLFVRTKDSRLLTSWQAGPSHPFGGWVDMGADGQFGSDAAAGLDANGAGQVVVRSGGGRVLTSWQSAANQPYGGWLDMGMPATAAGVPAIARGGNGGLQVFVHTTDNRLLTSWQPGAGHAFGGWLDLGLDGQISFDPAVGVNLDGSLVVYVQGTGQRMLTTWQPGPNQPFGGWLNAALPASAAGVPAIVREANGGMQVFVHTTDNRLLTSWQSAPGQPFGGWLNLGLSGGIASDASGALNADGTMQVFVRSTGNRVVTSWQSSVGGPFGGWLDLGLPGSALATPEVIMNRSGP